MIRLRYLGTHYAGGPGELPSTFHGDVREVTEEVAAYLHEMFPGHWEEAPASFFVAVANAAVKLQEVLTTGVIPGDPPPPRKARRDEAADKAARTLVPHSPEWVEREKKKRGQTKPGGA